MLKLLGISQHVHGPDSITDFESTISSASVQEMLSENWVCHLQVQANQNFKSIFGMIKKAEKNWLKKTEIHVYSRSLEKLLFSFGRAKPSTVSSSWMTLLTAEPREENVKSKMAMNF